MSGRTTGNNRLARPSNANTGVCSPVSTTDAKVTNTDAPDPAVWWVVGIICVVAIALLAIFRDQIVEKFDPHKDAIVKFPASWVIPIVILIVLSFPPLGGHEIVLLVVGLIWGIWIGFAIACAGTFLGEVACYYVFRYFLTEHAAKCVGNSPSGLRSNRHPLTIGVTTCHRTERKNVFYACVARMMRHGSLWM